MLLNRKNIFIAPLDWGLGHSTRCVPLIRQLQKNNRVIIGITPLNQNIFAEEFPELEKIPIPAYNISYSVHFPLWMKLGAEWPRIASVIRAEKKALRSIVRGKNIDTVISDNRFGLHSNDTHNIFVTHQVFLKSPFAEGLLRKLNKSYILNFDELWIPDFEDEKQSLSGQLSHGDHFHKKIKYLGPLSRLEKTITEKKYDYLFLLSGPEPQRSLFGNLLLDQAKMHTGMKFAMVSDGGNFALHEKFSNLDTYFSPGKILLSKLISGSEQIVCRSGYSTLMDLHLLGKKKTTLVATPGQTEQEYLAEHWEKNFGCRKLLQKEISKCAFTSL